MGACGSTEGPGGGGEFEVPGSRRVAPSYRKGTISSRGLGGLGGGRVAPSPEREAAGQRDAAALEAWEASRSGSGSGGAPSPVARSNSGGSVRLTGRSSALERVVSRAELAQHRGPESFWVAVAGDVFDVTAFRGAHPGGGGVLESAAGRDATQLFNMSHQGVRIEHRLAHAKVGRLAR